MSKQLLNSFKILQNKYRIENHHLTNIVDIYYNNYIIIHINISKKYPFTIPTFGLSYCNTHLYFKPFIANSLKLQYNIDNDILRIIFKYVDNYNYIIYNTIKELLLYSNCYNILEYDDLIDNILIVSNLHIIFDKIFDKIM
jgi:hypothetical protein